MKENVIKSALSSPSSCGVYMFLKGGKPIYIGKSKNIRERLKAYIELSDTRETVPKIVEEADSVKWILTPTEEDALFLEQKLIREHLPKYNIKLKDARGLKFIKLDMVREFPSISVVRYPKKDSSLYFGPFSARDANEIFKAVKNAFGIRTCNESKFKEFRKRGRPCIDGQIGVCSSPCVDMIKREDYMREVGKAVDFLQGKFSRVISELERKMWEEADKENFEIAAKLRDRINALRNSLDYKRIVFDDFRNADFLSYDIAFGKIGVWGVRIREGRFFGGYGGVFEFGGQDIKDLVVQVFTEHTGGEGLCISDVFDERMKIGRITLRPPEGDVEKEIIMNAKKNALEQILQLSGTKIEKLRLLDELGKFLLLPQTPRKIEVYDFSNFGGKNLVGAKIHFEDGEVIPSRIRIYKVSETGFDDYFALQNVLHRRLNDSTNGKDTPLPDLFMIDGGKGHYSVAKEVLREFGVDIPIVCIKKEKRNTRNISLIFAGEELKPKGKLLSFILKLRDSAHKKAKKFAVSSSTKSR